MDVDGDSGGGGGDEFARFTTVCFTVFASLTYCYFISKNIPKGFLRLLSVLPIIFIFTLLPFHLSSVILRSQIGFLIGWLANFRLLLFSFGLGPLSSDHPYASSSLTLPLFISLACLPIHIKHQNPPSTPNDYDQKNHSDREMNNHIDGQIISIKPPKSTLNYYAIEVLLLTLLLCVYDYFKQHLHYSPSLIMMKFLFCLQMYLILEFVFAMGAVLVRILFGLKVEPQFDNPYLSTSPQNFWGRRWNLVVSDILRATVYEPIRHICTRFLGRTWGLYVGVIATFVVSGIMHELVFFYMGLMQPVWDVMWFFVLSGICLAVEIAVKKAIKGRWQLNSLVSVPLTLGFIGVTSFWLFFPVFGRIGVDNIVNEEIATFAKFIRAKLRW